MSFETFVKNKPVIDSITKSAEDKILYMTGLICSVTVKLDQDLPALDTNGIIILKCCKAWDVDLAYIQENIRDRNRVTMRQIICFIIKMKYPRTVLKTIGENLGGLDHTSVIHCINKAKDHFNTGDELFMRYYKLVEHILYEEAITV